MILFILPYIEHQKKFNLMFVPYWFLYILCTPLPLQLYDWMVVNKIAVMDVLREQDKERWFTHTI